MVAVVVASAPVLFLLIAVFAALPALVLRARRVRRRGPIWRRVLVLPPPACAEPAPACAHRARRRARRASVASAPALAPAAAALPASTHAAVVAQRRRSRLRRRLRVALHVAACLVAECDARVAEAAADSAGAAAASARAARHADNVARSRVSGPPDIAAAARRLDACAAEVRRTCVARERAAGRRRLAEDGLLQLAAVCAARPLSLAVVVAAERHARLLREGIEANPGPPKQAASPAPSGASSSSVAQSALPPSASMAAERRAGYREERRQHYAERDDDARSCDTFSLTAPSSRGSALSGRSQQQQPTQQQKPQQQQQHQQQQHHSGCPRPAPPAAAAATAADAPTAPPQHLQQATRRAAPTPAPFFRAWLAMQECQLNTSTWLRVVEDVEELCDGSWRAARRRLLAVSLGGPVRAIPSNHAPVVEAGRALAATRSAEEAAAAPRKRSFKVLRFAACHAVELAPDTHVEYGRFPLLPHEPSSDGTFRASYVSMQVMAPDEIERLSLQSGALQPEPAAARDGMRLWTTRSGAEPAAVEETLAEFGTPIALEQRVADGVHRQAFRQLAAASIRGYRDADAAGRDVMLRRLIALPRMHLRRLVGSVSPRVRAQHAAHQLSGLVCTQHVVPEQQQRTGQRQHDDSQAGRQRAEDEHEDRCVRSAFKLACQGFTGRAAAALVRAMTVVISAAQKIADLTKLHPPGDPPEGVAPPALPAHSLQSVSIADVRSSVRAGLGGSAPGPDGWTFEALHDALEHDGFAHEFVAVVVDICNGHVTPGTCQLLAASWLVGIPKGTAAADGTRPIALGSVLLKVAAGRSLAAASKTLQQRFRGSQFGCATKGGGEFIVHATRRFLRTGVRPNGSVAGATRVVVTLDAANAFQSPHRRAMWAAVKDIPELIGIFSVSYGRHAPLYIVGTDAVLQSARGARQGTVDGPVSFALTLQSAINAANTAPDAQLLAYLDDVTILADSPAAAERAVAEFARRAAELGVLLKPAKCEIVTADPQLSVAACPTLQQFRRATVVKLLGASIAMSDAEEEQHLFARESEKAATFMRRLRHGASPQLFAVLRQCGVPKLGYAIRVHGADVSRRLCQLFDARVEELVAFWASTSVFTERQRLIIALPRSLGGMGLSRSELIAPAAYHASMSTALHGARRVSSQAALVLAVYRDVLDRQCVGDVALRRHLQVHSLDGTDAGLSFVGARVHPDVFGALLRSTLMADARTVTSTSLPCRGCGHTFGTGGAWGQHVSSCAIAKGGHATKRHNAVASLLRRGMAEAGMQPDATEPRDMASYACQCGLTGIPHERFVEHRKTCSAAGKQPLHASGPDIRFTVGGTTTVADVTILSLITASHAQHSAEDAFTAARATKLASYGAMCARAGVKLLPLPALATGHLGPELVATANQIADRTFRSRLSLRAELAASIAHGSAQARLAAEEAAGVRPATIAMQQVRLLEHFRHAPLPVDAPSPAAAPSSLPPLLPTPPAPISLEARIATGVDRALRDTLPKLAVEWVETVRASLLAADRARASERRAAAAAAAPAEAPDTAAAADADDPDDEAESFRARVAAQAEVDFVEQRVLADQVAADEALEAQRATTRAATAALQREAAARERQYVSAAEVASRAAASAREQSALIQRAADEASARHADAQREQAELEQTLRGAYADAATRLRAARLAAETAAQDAAASQEQLQHVQRRADATLANADAARAQSTARVQSLAAAADCATSQLSTARIAAEREEQTARQLRRKVLASQQREQMAAARSVSSSVAPEPGATTCLRRADTRRVAWADSPSPDARSLPPPRTPPARAQSFVREPAQPASRGRSLGAQTVLRHAAAPLEASPEPDPVLSRRAAESVRLGSARLGADDDDMTSPVSSTASFAARPIPGCHSTLSQAGIPRASSASAPSAASAFGSLCSAIASAVSGRSQSRTRQ